MLGGHLTTGGTSSCGTQKCRRGGTRLSMDVCTALAGGHWTEKLPDPVAPPAEPRRCAPCLCIIHRRVLVRNGYGAPSPPLSCHEIATTGVRMVTVRWLELEVRNEASRAHPPFYSSREHWNSRSGSRLVCRRVAASPGPDTCRIIHVVVRALQPWMPKLDDQSSPRCQGHACNNCLKIPEPKAHQ